MCKMDYAEQSQHLAGQIALLKMYLTRCAGDIATDAVQIFGGRSLTKTGMGKCVSPVLDRRLISAAESAD